jgi:SAM-dependent methyltransferase
MLLRDELGDIDIYLLDQLLRERITPAMRVVDAGCGQGRNLVYLLRDGYDVHGVDSDAGAIAAVQALAARLAPALPASNFRVEPVERMTHPDRFAAAVISSAVLHFARDDAHFDAMLREMWRVLQPGGVFFCRLASSIGMESAMRPLGHGRFALPDGSERYLVNEARLAGCEAALGARPLDPLKTTIVQHQRCMTTWVLQKV